MTKMSQEYLVVFITVMARGLNVNVLPFEDIAVWHGESQPHVAHPKMVDDK